MSQPVRKRYCSRCLTTFDTDGDACPNMGCQRKRPKKGWGRMFAAGDVFDRNYKIHRVLALGGAGITYMGRELGPDGEETGPRLALKVLFAARDQGPYLRRLATEAQIIQELDHPNIVQYLGFVHRAGHSPYLITRFESGGSLLDHVRRVGTLPVRRAAQIGRQMCWGLEKAHERGIVHRDLKPENVLMTRKTDMDEDTVVRLADFGIAKVSGSIGGGMTRVGAFVGTPHYAAPEQFVGGQMSPAADVYAVGAVVYFLCMARHVVRFADRFDPEEAFQMLVEALPAQIERPDEPDADVARLNRVLAVTMGLNQRDRCSIVEMEMMLGAIVAGRDPVVPEPRSADDLDLPPPNISAIGIAGHVTPHAAREDRLPEDQRMPIGAGLASGVGAAPDAEKPRVAVTSPVTSHAETNTTSGDLAAGGTFDSLDAARSDEGEPQGAKKSGGMGGVAMGLVGLVLVGGLGLAGLGLTVWQWPAVRVILEDAGLLAPGLPLPVDLTGDETDAGMQKDHRGIARSLDGLDAWLGRKCPDAAGKGPINLVLVIEASGAVRSASAKGGGAAGKCVAKQVQKATFSRSGAQPVRVELAADF